MFSWEQAQSFHIIGGIPIQANGMQFLARIPNVPDDEELLPSLTAGVWIFSNGLGSVGNNGELASASPVEKRHLQLVLEPKCPDLSGIHSLRKADLLLPSGRITVYIEDSNEYDLICWKTDMLERTPGAVPAHRRRPNIRGQVCDPERLPIRHPAEGRSPASESAILAGSDFFAEIFEKTLTFSITPCIMRIN